MPFTKKDLEREAEEMKRFGKIPFGGGEKNIIFEWDLSLLGDIVRFSDEDQLAKDIETLLIPGIKQRTEESGKKGIVLQIDGSINSAVSAYLATKALGNYWVRCLYMPCQEDMHSPYDEKEKRNREFSIDFCKWLDIDFSVFDITTPFTVLQHRINIANGSHTGGYGEISNDIKNDVRNSMRLVTQNAIKSHLDYLSLGTTDQTEYLYYIMVNSMDLFCDIEPLLNYFKNEVLKIGRILGLDGKYPHLFEIPNTFWYLEDGSQKECNVDDIDEVFWDIRAANACTREDLSALKYDLLKKSRNMRGIPILDSSLPRTYPKIATKREMTNENRFD